MSGPLMLLLAACLYPGGILDRSRLPQRQQKFSAPANRPGPADLALWRLIRHRGDAPAELVLAGDQIYVDATAGLFDPQQLDRPLERVYSTVIAQPWRRKALDRLEGKTPITLMDDHEVTDNWEPSAHPERNAALQRLLVQGVASFLEKQRDKTERSELWLERILISGHRLFAGDTRSERGVRDPQNLYQAQILSPRQFEAMFKSLEAAGQAGQYRFVATASMLLPRRLETAERPGDAAAALRSDAWDGYPASLHQVLGTIADRGLQGCVFLSGNEHIPCVTTVRLNRRDQASEEIVVWSVHAGALYAPYPFANSVPEDFVHDDEFEFTTPAGARWHCRAQARFPTHCDDGFMDLRVETGRSLEAWFRSARGPDRDEQLLPP